MKKTLRAAKKYAALDRNTTLPIRKEFHDYDYLDKLGKDELDWLNRFTAEDLHADFGHKGKRVYKKKMVTKVIKSTGQKRKFDVGKKDCYDRNNARNNDVYGKAQANYLLEGEESRREYDGVNEIEDWLIRAIDEDNRE